MDSSSLSIHAWVGGWVGGGTYRGKEVGGAGVGNCSCGVSWVVCAEEGGGWEGEEAVFRSVGG